LEKIDEGVLVNQDMGDVIPGSPRIWIVSFPESQETTMEYE
jgi:hypothetical protein